MRKILKGIGNGFNTSTVPVWVAETAKPNRRGLLFAVQYSIVELGLTLAYWVDYGCIQALSGGIAWRLPIALQSFLAFVALLTIIFLPESPRWLYAKGKITEGNLVVSRLRDVPLDSPLVQSTRETILKVVELENQGKGGQLNWKHLIYDPTPIKPTRRVMLGKFVRLTSSSSQCLQFIVDRRRDPIPSSIHRHLPCGLLYGHLVLCQPQIRCAQVCPSLRAQYPGTLAGHLAHDTFPRSGRTKSHADVGFHHHGDLYDHLHRMRCGADHGFRLSRNRGKLVLSCLFGIL
jgi:hypothetical protein